LLSGRWKRINKKTDGMSYLLAIDIGNTNITAGLFRNKRLMKKLKTPSTEFSIYSSGLSKICNETRHGIGRIVISSVVPVTLERVKRLLKDITGARQLIVGENVSAPIRNMYRMKSEVGQDRLIDAFAAKSLYGSPSVIIDFGTAITFDAVSGGGDYLGGLILPGIEMGLASLYKKTALLPKVELKRARHIIGRDTVDSMRGGILFGYGAMCDGLISKYRLLLGKGLKVIATGGNAKLIKSYAKSIQIVDEDLTLKGLRLISESRLAG